MSWAGRLVRPIGYSTTEDGHDFFPPAVDGGQWVWEVIHDPNPAQDLLGGRFRWLDLTRGAMLETWEDGIRFRNVNTGEEAEYRQGKIYRTKKRKRKRRKG